MNSPAARMAYKPFTLAPALGELVAALYPADEKWYRARVVSSTRVDQNIEVMYIDYGNTAWVLEDGVRQLAARHWALPAQAVPCALAGVRSRSQLSRDWADARALLTALISDKTVSARVISREYDGLTLELFNNEGDSIAERLAESKLVELTEYAVCDDSAITQRVVVP
ncbi:PREDICTED: tudor domain-containing protein 1-like [Papilio polytes]|uniref:tudor domain-containing protein 1-like n=1 Tax=Papilio polytes TaxID=76194 RepID=UPI000675F39A|nr:PREDICTED: tudor domain-containing protein 1-like [Papilio polytes]